MHVLVRIRTNLGSAIRQTTASYDWTNKMYGMIIVLDLHWTLLICRFEILNPKLFSVILILPIFRQRAGKNG